MNECAHQPTNKGGAKGEASERYKVLRLRTEEGAERLSLQTHSATSSAAQAMPFCSHTDFSASKQKGNVGAFNLQREKVNIIYCPPTPKKL